MDIVLQAGLFSDSETWARSITVTCISKSS
jgi:hypothetical protein